ncbi:MAG: MOSC domain-containing protein [Longimicrobiales bacterium]
MEASVGRLEAIWIKRAHGEPMDPVRSTVAVEHAGLDGNADQGGRRQVTLIEKEIFDGISEVRGEVVDPAVRRANFLLSGIRLEETRDRVLCVGDLRIEIRGETRPCELMNAQHEGLREALNPHWCAGAFGVVMGDATVSVGDEVRWE